MRHLVSLFVVVAVVLLGPLAIVQAQESTPGAEAGFAIEVLGAGPSSLAPGHGLVLARVTFPPGYREPRRHVHPFDYVFTVETGSYAFTIESGTLILTQAGNTEAEEVAMGEEVTIESGDSFAGNPEVVWAEERAVGDEQLVALVAFVGDPTAPESQFLDATPTP